MLNQFCLRIGTELVPETLYSNELTRLCAREDYIEFCNPSYWVSHSHVSVWSMTHRQLLPSGALAVLSLTEPGFRLVMCLNLCAPFWQVQTGSRTPLRGRIILNTITKKQKVRVLIRFNWLRIEFSNNTCEKVNIRLPYGGSSWPAKRYSTSAKTPLFHGVRQLNGQLHNERSKLGLVTACRVLRAGDQEFTYSGRLVALATKFCTVALNILNIIIAASITCRNV
jgi:hypothetical protein